MEHRSSPVCQIREMNGGPCIKYYYNKFEICGNVFDKRMYFDNQKYWDNCGKFYEARNITIDEFNNYVLHRGFNKGDIIVLRGTSFDELQVGEILVYQSKLAYPVIHRVVAKNDVIETKGDHNSDQILVPNINEKYITKDQIIGKAWFRIPYLGYVKIWFTQLLQCVTFNGCSF
jgi:hypothetical protein